jgi:hypothetical protein
MNRSGVLVGTPSSYSVGMLFCPQPGDWLSWLCILMKMAVFWVVEQCSLVNFYQTTPHNNPEDSHLRTHCHENLKSLWVFLCFPTLPMQMLDASKLTNHIHLVTWHHITYTVAWKINTDHKSIKRGLITKHRFCYYSRPQPFLFPGGLSHKMALF